MTIKVSTNPGLASSRFEQTGQNIEIYFKICFQKQKKSPPTKDKIEVSLKSWLKLMGHLAKCIRKCLRDLTPTCDIAVGINIAWRRGAFHQRQSQLWLSNRGRFEISSKTNMFTCNSIMYSVPDIHLQGRYVY